MAFIDIKKLTTVEECDKIIFLLIQESYKKYLDGKKEGQKYLADAIKIMDHSTKLKNKQNRKKKSEKRKQENENE